MSEAIPEKFMTAATAVCHEMFRMAPAYPEQFECLDIIARALMAADEAATKREREKEALGWQPIETAPEAKGKYFFCRLACQNGDEFSTGDGFRWDGKWFAAALFYKGGIFDERQYEYRQIQVNPAHWQPLPAPPILKGEA